jgi:hypothetical protein
MLRYLAAAFGVRPRIPGLGAFPVNLAGVAAFAAAGLANPAFWLIGLGVETAFLFGLASNSRFRAVVDARGLAPAPERPAPTYEELLRQVGQPERRRLEHLQELLGKILGLYAQFQVDEFTSSHNRDALRTLASHFGRLLVAKQNIGRFWDGDPREIGEEIAGLAVDLKKDGLSPELRASKTRTLEILQARLENQKRKDQALEEIEAELRRIEAQFELALENAAMSAQPSSVSADLNFDLSQLDAAVVGMAPAAPEAPEAAPPRRSRALN